MGFAGKPQMSLLLPGVFEGFEGEEVTKPMSIQGCFPHLNAATAGEDLAASEFVDFASSDFLEPSLEFDEPSSFQTELSEETLSCKGSHGSNAPESSDECSRRPALARSYSKNALWREILDERPRTFHLLASLLCISSAFALISLRRSNGPHLMEHKSSVIHAFDLLDRAEPPTCGARGPTLLARGAAAGAHGARALLGAGWAGIGTHYCGPPNGRDFSQAPSDVLDAACAQHDYCIERSLYPAGAAGLPRALYPVGVVDPDRFRRCGIPLQSHRTPGFAGRIAACDRELLDAVRGGFRCSADPALPKGPWCAAAALAGRRPCDDHRGTWRLPVCRTALSLVDLYHQWTLFRSAAPAPAAAAPASGNATSPAR